MTESNQATKMDLSSLCSMIGVVCASLPFKSLPNSWWRTSILCGDALIMMFTYVRRCSTYNLDRHWVTQTSGVFKYVQGPPTALGFHGTLQAPGHIPLLFSSTTLRVLHVHLRCPGVLSEERLHAASANPSRQLPALGSPGMCPCPT